MACTEKEFKEQLGTEMYVDMERLRDAARHGIPDAVRGPVWKYLLSVSIPDKSEEMSREKRLETEYKSLEKLNMKISRTLKSELAKRLMDQDFWHNPALKTKIEHFLCAFFNSHTAIEFEANFSHLILPFVVSLQREYEIYYCFEALVEIIKSSLTVESINKNTAHFMMLFRSTLPDLYTYFEDEEVEPNEWIMSWVGFFLSCELPLRCVLRLWDTYFAMEGFKDLHKFVCLAILENSQEVLMEFEHSEVVAYLNHLPDMDMDVVITQAYNLLEEVRSRELL